MSDPADLSGVWYGRYLSTSGRQDNRFIARLDDLGGGLEGSISEPDGRGGIRRARVDGARTGNEVHFVKQYDGSGGWDHSVLYAGTVDDGATVVDGIWQVEHVSGSFVMRRERFDAEELEDDEEIELTVR